MSRSVGVVLPAYRPDMDQLGTYIADQDEVVPTTQSVELDADETASCASSVRSQSKSTPCTIAAGSAAITAGFELLETDVWPLSTPMGRRRQLTRTDTGPGHRQPNGPRCGLPPSPGRDGRHPPDVCPAVPRRRLRVAGPPPADVPLYDYQCGAKAVTPRRGTTFGPTCTSRGSRGTSNSSPSRGRSDRVSKRCRSYGRTSRARRCRRFERRWPRRRTSVATLDELRDDRLDTAFGRHFDEPPLLSRRTDDRQRTRDSRSGHDRFESS